MIPRQTLATSSHERSFSLGWKIILGLVVFSALCILGAGSLARLVFPASCFLVGAFLYRRYPILYIGFTLWLWFITPLLRRIVDWRSGWDERGVMIVTPLLVTLITLATFLRYLPRSYSQGGLPFVMAATGVFYGFLIGMIRSPGNAPLTFLNWLTPILFSFHFFVNWRDYPSYRQNIQRVFLWGVLAMGAYGVVQYVIAPEWDRLWLISSKMTSSCGNPEPFAIRVWSTMNAPGPFALTMIAGLLMLFSSQEALRIPASAAGYLAFLLSMVRSAWGGWLLGLVTLITSLKAHLQMRLIITILMMAICVIPLTTIAPFSNIINSRVQSLSNLENDTSANDRKALYNNLLNLALSEVQGQGLGSVGAIDSGILDILLSLGWLGAIFYLGGILLLIFSLFQGSEGRSDPFVGATRAIIIAFLMQFIFTNVTAYAGGVVFWSFIGMGMAAQKYYRHQSTAVSKREQSS